MAGPGARAVLALRQVLEPADAREEHRPSADTIPETRARIIVRERRAGGRATPESLAASRVEARAAPEGPDPAPDGREAVVPGGRAAAVPEDPAVVAEGVTVKGVARTVPEGARTAPEGARTAPVAVVRGADATREPGSHPAPADLLRRQRSRRRTAMRPRPNRRTAIFDLRSRSSIRCDRSCPEGRPGSSTS